MAHAEQIQFCNKVKNMFPEMFKNKKVLDVGSLDVNGNNRYLFENCEYVGIDVAPGRNVDIVSPGHKYLVKESTYDFIISTECFEHDMYYKETLINIVKILKSGGMFLFTCATTGRAEHGTRRSDPNSAPLLNNIKNWCDYYKNLTEQDIINSIDVETIFYKYCFETNTNSKDLYFYGIKK